MAVFAVAAFFAMELIMILNRCHHFSGFVYQHARFSPDKKTIEIAVRPRTGSTAVCSGCHQPAPGYDHLPERRFEFAEILRESGWEILQMDGEPYPPAMEALKSMKIIPRYANVPHEELAVLWSVVVAKPAA